MRISDWSSDVCSSDLPGLKLIQALGSKVLQHFVKIQRYGLLRPAYQERRGVAGLVALKVKRGFFKRQQRIVTGLNDSLTPDASRYRTCTGRLLYWHAVGWSWGFISV